MSEPQAENVYRDGYRPSPIADPRRTFADGRWTVILTRELSHPAKRVWEALTEPGQLRQWAPFTVNRDLAALGEVTITMSGADDPAEPADLPGHVLASDPPRLLVYRWGDDVLRWELTSTEDGTTLVLSHTLTDEGFTSAVAAGWHICLDVADALMSDVPFGPVVGRRAKDYGWDDLNHHYAEILGVQAFAEDAQDLQAEALGSDGGSPDPGRDLLEGDVPGEVR
jgi:uncharacterized protein YndB with AHSA1/START domain